MGAELDLQTKCRHAVEEMGGFAFKMSNRFLIGVPDLLIQLSRTGLWEVKQLNFMGKYEGRVPVKTSPKQKQFLRDYTLAGGFGGVIVFRTGIADLQVGIKPVKYFAYEDVKRSWSIPITDFVPLPRGCKFQPFKDLLAKVYEEGDDRYKPRS